MTLRIPAYALVVVAFGMLLWRCGGPEYAGGSEVVGMTVARTGDAVPDASVTAFRQSGETYDSITTVTSDRNGRFLFSTLDTGTYKLIGFAVAGDTLVGMKSDVVNSRIAPKGEPPARVDAGDLILKPKGWISGRVITDKTDMTGVLCYTRDSAFIAISRQDGSYTIPRVAEGTYTVCFFYSGYLPERLDGVVVVSGSGTTLPPVTLMLDPDGRPNPPRGVVVSYDTIHGVATLRWNEVPVNDLREYVVFRLNAGVPSLIDTIRDTLFRDTVFRDFSDTAAKTVEYQVAAIDNDNNQSDFSNKVTVVAVPPSTVRPVVRSVSADTVVTWGGTVSCRVVFTNAFNDYRVFMSFNPTLPWVEVSHSSDGIADTSFSTGAGSTGGRVGVSITFAADTIDTFFVFRVRPRNVAIVAADSTDSTITLRWNHSLDSDFREYVVHRSDTADSVVFRSARITDTAYTHRTLSMTAADYWIAVADTEGVTTLRDSIASRRLRIVNTPPRFTVGTGVLFTTALVDEEAIVSLTALDRNNDSLTFAIRSPAGAVMDKNDFIWSPTIDDLGAQQCTVTVNDRWGGADTLAWSVQVGAHEIWDTAASLIGPRRQCGIASLGGAIYALGGSINKTTSTQPMALKTVEAYDTVTRAWTAKAPMANARWSPFVAAWNNRIYVMGGINDRGISVTAIEEYDPAADTWTTVGQMPFSRTDGGACVIGNRLYCVGGKIWDATLRSYVMVKSIDIFDLSTKTWTKGPDMRSCRTDHQAFAYNGKICIIGGFGGSADSIAQSDNEERMISAIELYDPQTSRCDSIAALLTPRSNFAAAALGDSLYILGGYRTLTVSDDETILAHVELFQPSLRRSEPSISLPFPLHSAQAIGVGGRIYCVGGIVGDKTTGKVLVYYP